METIVQKKHTYIQFKKETVEKKWRLERVTLHITSKKSKDILYINLPSEKIQIFVDPSLSMRITNFIEKSSFKEPPKLEMLDYLYPKNIPTGGIDISPIECEIGFKQRKFFKESHLERFMDYNIQGGTKSEDEMRGTIQLSTEELANRVYRIIRFGKFQFWSVEGVAKELGNIERGEIEDILGEDKRFRKSWFKTQDWKNLYTLSDRPVGGKERFAQFIANIRSFRRPWVNDYAPEYI